MCTISYFCINIWLIIVTKPVRAPLYLFSPLSASLSLVHTNNAIYNKCFILFCSIIKTLSEEESIHIIFRNEQSYNTHMYEYYLIKFSA